MDSYGLYKLLVKEKLKNRSTERLLKNVDD